ncbi:hypothetical protein [Parafilimonas sp.]|uniref:hypothetical protein n=1 Tax=Parafilimonas sp. TaxID=1969739 RepID=UPI0039E3CAD5
MQAIPTTGIAQGIKHLDAAVEVLGALDLPAVPPNINLEKAMLPTAEKVRERVGALLDK